MRVNKIVINQILGIEHLEIEPGSVTLIEGANGTGKTSALDALRSAFSGAHDGTLLRNGAESGEVVLILEDGTELHKTITPDKSDLVVKHPAYGKISKPATFIKKLADILSLNPIEFLTAPAKERVDLLLKAVPMKVTADQLGFLPVEALSGLDLDRHALEVIGIAGRAVYDLRTGTNRAGKEKRATASQMAETLPPDAPEGNWGDAFSKANATYREEYKKAQNRIGAIQSDARVAIDGQKELFRAKKEELCLEFAKTEMQRRADLEAAITKLRDEFDRGIRALSADTDIAIERCKADADTMIVSVEEHRDASMRELQKESEPRLKAMTEEIAHCKAMLEQSTKAESAREFIGRLNADAEQLEQQSQKFTAALAKLETLKASLLANLPIPGMEIKDGEIHIGGIVYDRVNESKRIRLAIEVAKLRAGTLGLVAVDGLERLDPKTFTPFKKEAAKSGLQFVVARVTADETLQVRKGAVNE